jgi:hypothetical protein
MFVAFHADAYFSMGGEVLLYIIVRVEVIEIQIGLEFGKDLKNKKAFPIFIWPWAEFDLASPAEPTPVSLTRGPGAAQRRSSPTPR